MLRFLTGFAALSLCGTVVLSLLPEGNVKRTAGMAVGLVTLLCWAEGVCGLLRIELPGALPSTVLTSTECTLVQAEETASLALANQWEVLP